MPVLPERPIATEETRRREIEREHENLARQRRELEQIRNDIETQRLALETQRQQQQQQHAQPAGNPAIEVNITQQQARRIEEITAIVSSAQNGNIEFKIPKFKDEVDSNPSEFIEELEKYFKVKNVQNDRKLIMVESALMGKAALWYEIKANFRDFESFKQGFLDEFYSIPIRVLFKNRWLERPCNVNEQSLQTYYYQQVRDAKYFSPQLTKYEINYNIIQQYPVWVREALATINYNDDSVIAQSLASLDSTRRERTRFRESRYAPCSEFPHPENTQRIREIQTYRSEYGNGYRNESGPYRAPKRFQYPSHNRNNFNNHHYYPNQHPYPGEGFRMPDTRFPPPTIQQERQSLQNGKTAMGTILQDDDLRQQRYRLSLKRMGEYFYYRAAKPWLKSDWIFSLTQMGWQHAADLKILHCFTTEIIANRKRFHEETGGKHLKIFSSVDGTLPESSVPSYDTLLVKKRIAMLDILIAEQKERGMIDDRGIREEVDTFMFEGHDSTNISMSFAVLLLAENKQIQARARDEIDAVLKESNGQLGMVQLQNMTYLDCCVKEALRLYPAVPLISRKLTEDLQLKNFLLPPGTTAAVQIYDLHRDPNFWPNPEVFNPDRFLPERIAGRHPFSYIPFSAGPRNCIGQKYAMLEFKAFIGLILHNFYLEPMMETSSVHMLPDLILKSQHPLNVKFIPIQ